MKVDEQVILPFTLYILVMGFMNAFSVSMQLHAALKTTMCGVRKGKGDWAAAGRCNRTNGSLRHGFSSIAGGS